MKCPNCEKDLIAVEKEGLELDFCPSCKGFWFDAWEWDDLAKIVKVDEKEFKELTESNQSFNNSEAAKKCPVCNRRMEKINVYNNINLDRCVADGGVWFDGEELSKVLQIIADRTGIDKTPLEKYLNELYTGQK